MDDKERRDFLCAAISDNILAIGASEGSLLIFSIGEGEQSLGKCIFKREQPGHHIDKVLFNPDNTELVVFYRVRGSREEHCQFYSMALYPLIAPARRPSEIPVLSAKSEVILDLNYSVEGGVYPYTMRHATFSTDGRRLVGCTNHNQGSALIFIIIKNEDDEWILLGRDQIAVDGLDNWDVGCLGFTGISLYDFQWKPR